MPQILLPLMQPESTRCLASRLPLRANNIGNDKLTDLLARDPTTGIVRAFAVSTQLRLLRGVYSIQPNARAFHLYRKPLA